MFYDYSEHGAVMDHFVALVDLQLCGNICKVMREQKYSWSEDTKEKKTDSLDISILCGNKERKGLAYTGTPRFIVEVLSESIE